ncbi:MAG TPA: DNA internalization-related competence protein ComEC/Rec2 [Burkholderiaceae bacterium]
MRTLAAGFLLGVVWLQSRAALPALPFCAIALTGALLLALALRRHRYLLQIALACAACAAGVGWSTLIAAERLADALPLALEGRDLTVTGTVRGLPAEGAGATRLLFDIQHASEAGVPPRVSLAWYNAPPAFGPGQRWRLRVRLQRPHGNANPYGFDYEAWLLEQGVRATGYVRGGAVLLDPHVIGTTYSVARLRAALRTKIRAALPDARYAGVIQALVIGEQRDIGADDWTLFTRTGIGHLVSISGLHITMLAALAAVVTSAAWRRTPHLPLLLPAQKAGAAAGLAVAIVYVLLAGAGIPALRTLAMLAVAACALHAGRTLAVSRILALALIAVLLFDPWAVLAPGFWLSYAAVTALVFAASREADYETGWRARLREAARAQWAVTVGLVPLTLLLFGQVSLVSPLANALAIPVVSLFVTPLALLGAVLPAPLSVWLLHLAHAGMAALVLVLEPLAASRLAVWSAPVPGALAFGLAACGAIWLLLPRGWPLRWAGCALLLPVACTRPDAPPPGVLRATVLDVGQGGAVLLETANHRLLYDTGPAYGPATDAGARVVLPYLRGRGIARLDGVVVSHADTDHAGGLQSLRNGIGSGWILSSMPGHARCEAGQHWTWDGVRFDVLHPTPASYGQSASDNARSCVLRVAAGRYAMLLTGDIEAPQERELIARAGIKADVLLAPHHGSGTSSTDPLLDAVGPSIAIFQVGHRNRYRHPKIQVWDRYGERGIARWRTDRDGALTVELGGTVTITSWRAEQPRYWHGH